MQTLGLLFRLLGGLCIFLYGMKVLSDGIQQAAGDRLQRVLNFMTGNRFIAVFTGFCITALVQSSSATTVMLVSFVNAGLLTLTQAIGVIMGANIGTTTTAWLVSLAGYNFDISALALPAVGIGFLMRLPRWKHRDWGEAVLGFGFIFIGLEFINGAVPGIKPGSLEFIRTLSGLGFASTLIGLGAGTLITLLMHSSAATITLVIALSYRGITGFEIAAAIILGANIGTTIDAILAAVGAKTAAKQAALGHVLFNVVGSLVALAFFTPLLALVNLLTPGTDITTRLAMFHTVFNIFCTALFLPFTRHFASLVAFFIKDKKSPGRYQEPYRLEWISGLLQGTPEFNIVRAEKEISGMAGLVSDMYAEVSGALTALAGTEKAGTAGETPDGEPPDDEPPDDETLNGGKLDVDELVAVMKAREAYADQMREELSRFLIECSRQQLSPRSEYNISQLLRIIADLEDMADDCCGISMILERSVKKKQRFKRKETEALAPYVGQVEDFLSFVREHLGHPIGKEQIEFAEELEIQIDKSRNKLRKLGRKRIEAGADVKTELLFMDLVRRIERLGDFCYNISEALFHMN
ncbi:MAG: Na/Pi cotransporter family protein [Treponema sp.]|jgi:phosphate:Na+ symporter|nr:Na/Pi cotransporter family protein [Treponema sp.]